MHLITTADETFWKIQKEIALLGEWCKLWSRRNFWEKTHHEILPYHWDNRNKLYQDNLYLGSLYERILAQMTYKMNEIHNVNYSKRYWRIILGPWLSSFLCIFFDRYESIKYAGQSGKITNSLIGKYDPAKCVPNDIRDFIHLRSNDKNNHYIFSQIIELTRPFQFESMNVSGDFLKMNSHKSPRQRKPGLFKRNLLNFVEFLGRNIPDKLNQVVLVTSYLPPFDLVKIQISMGQFPFIVHPYVKSPKLKYCEKFRAEISIGNPKNLFEQILSKVIKCHIPSIYIEGYKDMHDKSLDAFPRKPRVIFTACAFETDEGFKFWAAHQVDQGVKLAGMQHGANFGAVKWMHDEDHQIKISDRYFTWGWVSNKYSNTKPLTASKLIKCKKMLKPNPNGGFILTTFAYPRYAYKMYSVPVSSSQMLVYLKSQFRFVQALGPKLQNQLLVRLFPIDRNWFQKERWNQEFPNVRTYKGTDIHMATQLNESRLHVTMCNGTPHVETFAANFPTVLFWEPVLQELRSSATAFYNHLKNVGILHDTPEDAALKVKEIFDDPISWWKSPEVQEAKDQFCHMYARISENWKREWKNELMRLKNLDLKS